ncbi:MAG: hypothetical protein RLZZ450_3805 [Pseudomonadota bacterium]
MQPGSFPVRNLKFDLSEVTPRYWLAGQRSVTAFFNNLSVFFPAGERFFTRGKLHTLFPHYLAYYKRDFEPWQLDNRELVERWKVSLAA